MLLVKVASEEWQLANSKTLWVAKVLQGGKRGEGMVLNGEDSVELVQAAWE